MKKNHFKKDFTITLLLTTPLFIVQGKNGHEKLEKPNILWIVVDDIGIELPCYGTTGIKTPNINRLVSEGTLFKNAFLTASISSPSRSSMITGMYQTTIGANNHLSGRGEKKIFLPNEIQPFPALFKQQGYYTCNGDYPLKSKSIGKTDYNFEWDESIYDGNDWAGRKHGQPFFAQVQLWGGKNRDNARWKEIALKELGNLTPPSSVFLPPYYPRDSVILNDWASYLDCIRYTDKQVGEIIKRLETEGILDKTIIIFMGDNGISHARGKQFLYDEGIRTPFIVKGPGVKAGAIRTDLIEHIDMGAISLGFSSIQVPSWMQGRDVFSKKYNKRNAVFSARDRAGETVDRIRALRTERYKYIKNFYPDRPYLQPSNYKDNKAIIKRLRELHVKGELNELQEKLLFASSRPAEELYDIINDPFETVNLAQNTKYLNILRKLRLQLQTWSKKTNDPEPEIPEIYDIEMRYQLDKTKSNDKAKVLENIELMKRWQTERPYKKAI